MKRPASQVFRINRAPEAPQVVVNITVQINNAKPPSSLRERIQSGGPFCSS